mgnify:CR=1 FL=1
MGQAAPEALRGIRDAGQVLAVVPVRRRQRALIVHVHAAGLAGHRRVRAGQQSGGEGAASSILRVSERSGKRRPQGRSLLKDASEISLPFAVQKSGLAIAHHQEGQTRYGSASS